jgi:hypothetical protein
MKAFARICTGMAIAAGLFATCAARAQVVSVADEIRPDDEGAYYGGYRRVPGRPVAAVPGDIMAPPEVISLLRADGYAPIGPALQRGWIYTVAVVTPDGNDGRLVVDARTGDPIRFIPAMRIDARMSEELDFMYGPPGPPPDAYARDLYTRANAPRPPAAVPNVAQRPPVPYEPRTAAIDPRPVAPPPPHVAGIARPHVARTNGAKGTIAKLDATNPELAKPDTAKPVPAEQATARLDAKPDGKPDDKAEAKQADTKQADTKPPEVTAQATTTGQAPSKPEASKPADKPGEVHLKPTEPKPPVQTFE